MKKFLMMVAMIATMVFTSCEKEKKTVSFLDTLKADYEQVVASHSDSVIVFYEAQCELDGTVNERKEVSMLAFREVFQGDSMVYLVDRCLTNDSVAYDSVKGYWMEDLVIGLDSICDFNTALESLYKADMVLPESNLVTLRRPLYSVQYNPLYVFGSVNTSFVAVDAVTLEVFELK